MTRYLLFLFANLLPVLCFAQNIKFDTIDVDRQDILVFNFIEHDISLVEFAYGTICIYKDKNMIGLRNRWRGYGSSYIDKKFMFTQGCDTMRVAINCGQNCNFYFRNMEFRKGDFNIRIADKYDPNTLIKGEDISCDIYLNNLFLKNAYRDYQIKEDRYFKYIDFYEINMQDDKKIEWKKQ